MSIGILYDVAWGSSRLWCSRVTSDAGRSIVIHELAEGDEHPTQDRGSVPGSPVTCELLFVDMPNEATPPLERFLAFKRQVELGGPRLFVHPIDGAYYAEVQGFSYTIDEDGNIESAVATFVRSALPAPPVEAGTGTPAAAGEDAVEARAAELEDELEAVGVTSTAPAEATAALERWRTADEVQPRQVIADVASLSERLASLIEDEGLEHDLLLWPVYLATVRLGDAVRAAALAALAEAPRLTSIRIAQPIATLVLAARIYGGALAEDMERQIRALNPIARPGWIDAGTVLAIPIPPRDRRST